MKNNNQEKNKQFKKLRGKKLFLSYLKINSSIKDIKEKALEQLRMRLKGMEYYVIGFEKSEDGSVNLYCFFELKAAFYISHANYLDLFFEDDGYEHQYHGDYKIGKKKNTLIEYIISKDDDYFTNMELPIKNKKGILLKLKHEDNSNIRDLFSKLYPDIDLGPRINGEVVSSTPFKHTNEYE